MARARILLVDDGGLSLRRKADWLDKRIDAELRESDPLEQPRVAKIDPDSHVA